MIDAKLTASTRDSRPNFLPHVHNRRKVTTKQSIFSERFLSRLLDRPDVDNFECLQLHRLSSLRQMTEGNF